jgi:hypothetical protein
LQMFTVAAMAVFVHAQDSYSPCRGVPNHPERLLLPHRSYWPVLALARLRSMLRADIRTRHWRQHSARWLCQRPGHLSKIQERLDTLRLLL